MKKRLSLEKKSNLIAKKGTNSKQLFRHSIRRSPDKSKKEILVQKAQVDLSAVEAFSPPNASMFDQSPQRAIEEAELEQPPLLSSSSFFKVMPDIKTIKLLNSNTLSPSEGAEVEVEIYAQPEKGDRLSLEKKQRQARFPAEEIQHAKNALNRSKYSVQVLSSGKGRSKRKLLLFS